MWKCIYNILPLVFSLGLVVVLAGCQTSDPIVDAKPSVETTANVTVDKPVVVEQEYGDKPEFCFPRFKGVQAGEAKNLAAIDLGALSERAKSAEFYVLEHYHDAAIEPGYIHIEQGGDDYVLEISISKKPGDEERFHLDGCGDVATIKEHYEVLFSTLELDADYLEGMVFEQKKPVKLRLIDWLAVDLVFVTFYTICIIHLTLELDVCWIYTCWVYNVLHSWRSPY